MVSILIIDLVLYYSSSLLLKILHPPSWRPGQLLRLTVVLITSIYNETTNNLVILFTKIRITKQRTVYLNLVTSKLIKLYQGHFIFSYYTFSHVTKQVSLPSPKTGLGQALM